MITPQEIGKRIKDLLEGWDAVDEEMRRVSLIQMRNLRPSERTLRIDADSLLYYVAYAPSYKPAEAIEGGSFIGDIDKVHFKDYKQHFNNLVQDIVTECELASFRNELPRFKDFELVFTPSTNFRYEIFPEYKKNRVNKPQSNILKRLKRWAKVGSLSKVMRVIVPDNVEADDYVYYHAMKGDPVASGDKDVVNSVPAAYYYHSNHRRVVTNTPNERARWILLQTLAGDPSDDIPGLKGVALKTADKLLPDGGTMDDVIKIYESKGYTKDDAILTRRLVGLDQLNRIGKVRLFQW